MYLPCVLQTKKRYVGYMYESPDQLEPVFDAKGIETVRRDSCPAVSMVIAKYFYENGARLHVGVGEFWYENKIAAKQGKSVIIY